MTLVAATFAGMFVPWPNAVAVGDNAYWVVVISMMTGFMLGALGVLLGVAALVRHCRHGPPHAAPPEAPRPENDRPGQPGRPATRG